LLGITSEQIVLQQAYGDTYIERLWFSSPTGYSTFGNGTAIAKVVSQIKSEAKLLSVSAESKKQGGRIYVSRASAFTRRIVNEDKLLPFLEKYRFQVVRFEKYSFLEQVEIAENARVLVGPHGAGLTNLLFVNSPGRIGEIAGQGGVPCYSFMSRQLGHKFSRLIVEQEQGKGFHGDYIVDPEAFDKWLGDLCSD
jgi:hypothetical protein